MVIGDCSTERVACCGQLEVPVVVSLQESLAPCRCLVYSGTRDLSWAIRKASVGDYKMD